MPMESTPIPPDLEISLRGAVAIDYPDRKIASMRIYRDEEQRWIVHVFLAARVRPTPYAVYAVAKESLSAAQLSGLDAKNYEISGYR